jgi:Leucine-rich repeat (LRR) protein
VNQLSGSIPTQLGRLSSMQVLQLERNSLTGSLPTEIGRLTSMLTIFAFKNQLTGQLPTELGLLPELTNMCATTRHLSPLTAPHLISIYLSFTPRSPAHMPCIYA